MLCFTAQRHRNYIVFLEWVASMCYEISCVSFYFAYGTTIKSTVLFLTGLALIILLIQLLGLFRTSNTIVLLYWSSCGRTTFCAILSCFVRFSCLVRGSTSRINQETFVKKRVFMVYFSSVLKLRFFSVLLDAEIITGVVHWAEISIGRGNHLCDLKTVFRLVYIFGWRPTDHYSSAQRLSILPVTTGTLSTEQDSTIKAAVKAFCFPEKVRIHPRSKDCVLLCWLGWPFFRKVHLKSYHSVMKTFIKSGLQVIRQQ